LLSDTPANVASPLAFVAIGFVVTVSVDAPALLAIASVTLSAATALPLASCTCATTGIVVPAVALVGCVENEIADAAPAVMLNALLFTVSAGVLASVTFNV